MDESIKIEVAGTQLSGTVILPEKGVPVAFAIIHAGSGPTDRNGNSHIGLNTDCYKLLAHELSQAGIASLRYDKRGVGSSKLKNSTEEDLRISDYINDLSDCITFVVQKYRIEPFLIGHSEGALICLAAALNNPNVCGLVSISGTSQKIQNLLLEQIEKLMPESLSCAQSIIRSIENDTHIENIPSELSAIFRDTALGYLQSRFKLDPCTIISEIEVPVLVVGSESDRQVTSKDSKKLSQCSSRAQYLEVEYMSHTLKHIDVVGYSPYDEYTDASLPLSQKLADAVSEFIRCNCREL